MLKTSVRFFEDVPVRAVWDNETSKWWYAAADIAEALTKSKNPTKAKIRGCIGHSSSAGILS